MKQQGEVTELRFYLELFERGLIVSKPFGDNAKYDFIVDSGERLTKVQVKSVSVKDECSRNDRYRINATHGNKVKRMYTTNQCDVLAGYVIPEDTWYLIPIHLISGSSINLYPHKDTEIGMYEKYKEFWQIF